MKDWKGNTNSIYVTMGASNHSAKERETNDYYATEPKAVELLLEKESFSNVWEPACGEKHISNVLRKHGIEVRETDLIDRTGDIEITDFLKTTESWGGDIITNPPYKFATEFVQKSLEIIPENRKVAMFLKLQFLEGKARRELFRIHPPKNIYVASSRLNCAMNGAFEKNKSNAVCYAWFVWEKGYNGKPQIDWIN